MDLQIAGQRALRRAAGDVETIQDLGGKPREVRVSPVLTIKWLDFSISPRLFLPLFWEAFIKKATLQELLGAMGLEPTDCRGKSCPFRISGI